jgi:SAM-dependent methyltransferase
MNMANEWETWRNQVAAWFGPDAHLIHVSAYSSDVRVYQSGERVLKARRLTPSSISGRLLTLEEEFHLLRQLNLNGRPLPRLPRAVRYLSEPGWEAFEMNAVDRPLVSDPVISPVRETVAGLGALVRATWRLNRAGVSHGDLTRANAGRNERGEMTMLDFDQAIHSHPVRCLARDFLGIPCQGRGAQFTVWDRFCQLRLLHPLFGLIQRLRDRLGRTRLRDRRGTDNPTAWAQARGDAQLLQLAECWQEAATSGANSPGSRVAYYSLDVAGLHLPGERPWVLRWEIISGAVSFRGKRVVELGCNLGLLAIHASLAGARDVIGVDNNPRVLDAARKAAAAFGAKVAFRLVDFDRDQAWEPSLGPGDLVTALSVTYWLHDKQRLWTYLAQFPEVVFEGHEPPEEIEGELKSRGFAMISRLGVSERNRVIFHATRPAPSL